MRILLFFLFGLLVNTPLFAQGKLAFQHPNMELGKIMADNTPQTVIFHFKNTGSQPIIIKQVTPMTPLFQINWNRTPILPGESSTIEVTFTSCKLIQDQFYYNIFVYSNAQNNRLELSISGQLVDNPSKPNLRYKQNIDGLKFKSKHINLGSIYTWQIRTDTIYFINQRPETVELGLFRQPTHITAQFIPQQVKSGEKGMLLLTYNATKKNDYGYQFEPLLLSINGNINYSNQINISTTLLEDFTQWTKEELAQAPIATFDRTEYDFGELQQDEKRTCKFILTNTGESPLYIRKTKTSCGCTAVKLSQPLLAPKSSMTIQIVFDPSGKSGYQNKTITMITNDPQKPETILKIKGIVNPNIE